MDDTLDSPYHGGNIPPNEARIQSEIDYFEKRLSAIGQSGDCAYEKSLARTYHCLLRQRRTLLADLRAGKT
ncbi:MAG: hypothetical protein KGJ12_03245 [Gammaproteobacteria bacterium]|nr:hypothetical protein [Gammaproteobacteria bacterium]